MPSLADTPCCRTDAELVALVRGGDANPHWEELEARHGRAVVSTVRAVLAGRGYGGACDEITRDAFSKAYQRLELYDPSRPFRHWLRAIARNAARDWKRSARRHRHAGLDGLPARSADATADGAAAAERLAEARGAVFAALGELSPLDRSLFVRYFRAGAAPAALAAAHGLAVQTVRARISRAKKRALRAGLGGARLSTAQLRLLLTVDVD
jgi:RNA polymerase sigma-70 factor (ECF subfamily)